MKIERFEEIDAWKNARILELLAKVISSVIPAKAGI